MVKNKTLIVSLLTCQTINKPPKKEKIRKSTPKSYVSSLIRTATSSQSSRGREADKRCRLSIC